MDTFSTSVSTFKIPSLNHPKSQQYFKNHFPQPQQQQPHLITSITKPKPSKLSNKTTTLTTPFVNTSSQATLPQKQSSNTPLFHQKPAATGYAVALLDIARHHNVIEAVQRDVKRLSKYLRNEQLNGIMTNISIDTKEKGDIVKEVVKKAKFHKHLVKLVTLLADKTKVEMVSEVLMEFRRIYDELSSNSTDNTQLVLVSSGTKKMEQNQVLEIAQRVQKLTGAMKVKVRQQLVA